MKYKKYKKDFGYSYAIGSFSVLNLINSRPQIVETVFCHEKLSDSSLALIKDTCHKNNIKVVEQANKEVERIRNKDREFVFAVFNKYQEQIQASNNHIVLDKPSDMGNLGSIIRTALGFNFNDIAIIGKSCDMFNPKTIRASMGAIFDVRIQRFEDFEAYKKIYETENRNIYCFILGGKIELKQVKKDTSRPFSLIFGNESSGLDDFYKNVGESIYIEHSNNIDSLNLGIASSIAMYNFSS